MDLNADLTADEVQMMQAMGIPFSFDSTQGKQVRLAVVCIWRGERMTVPKDCGGMLE